MKSQIISKKSVFKTMFIVVCACALALTLTACGGGSEKSSKSDKSSAETVEVSLIDDPTSMSIDPATITVKSGTNLILKATNNGTVPHNISMEDGMATADIAPYADGSLEVGKVNKTTVIFCSIAGHRDQGMEMTIEVE